MTKSKPLALSFIFTAAVSGCQIKAGDLEAGVDDEESSNESPDTGNPEDEGADSDGADSNDCLIGTQIDAVGVEQSILDPQCEVVCAEGWGHGGEQLPIAWTTSVTADGIGERFSPRAIGLLDNGHSVVAVQMDHSLDLLFFDPAGQPYGGYDAPNIGSVIFGAEIDQGVLYVTHGEGDGIIVLSAIDVESQQELWTQAFSGAEAAAPARGEGNVAFLLWPVLGLADRELVMLDLDGNHQWTQPTLDSAWSIAFSPSGDRIAVASSNVRVHASEDGALIDEFVHGLLPNLASGVVDFVAEDRLVTVGAGYTNGPLQGWLSGDSLAGSGHWEQVYNRASAWCPDPGDDWATGEWFLDVAALADGSVLAVGHEGYNREGKFSSQPRIVQFTPDGVLLAGDRVLWDGIANHTVAGPDGSALIVFIDLVPDQDLQGFSVRKYVP